MYGLQVNPTYYKTLGEPSLRSLRMKWYSNAKVANKGCDRRSLRRVNKVGRPARPIHHFFKMPGGHFTLGEPSRIGASICAPELVGMKNDT